MIAGARSRWAARPPLPRAALLCAAILGCLLLGACGEGAWMGAPASATPGTTVLAPQTSAPTPTPEPDPLLDSWTDARGSLVLALRGNGTYEAAYLGGQSAGEFRRDAETLTFRPNGGQAYTVNFALTGAGLTLEQRGQEALVLVRSGDGGPSGTLTAPTDSGETESAAVFGIAYAYAKGGVVTVEMAAGMRAADCCFTLAEIEAAPAADSPDWMPVDAEIFSVFKTDGAYRVWVRDADGLVAEPYAVTVNSGFNYVIQAEGLTSLEEPLSDFLAANGSSVEELNAAISADVAAAGLNTRCGVVTAAVSIVSHMAEYGASVTYQAYGTYQDENDWGVNGEWGSRLKKPLVDSNGTYYYSGMHCVASIVWAYKQAGVNLSNTGAGTAIAMCGERERKEDNKIAYNMARGGDIGQFGHHLFMVVDRLDTDGDGVDDAYMTYEMQAPSLVFLVFTFQQLHRRTFFSMDAVFENEGRLQSRARFWENTFFISEDALPAYLTDAVADSAEQRPLERLLRGLGLLDG